MKRKYRLNAMIAALYHFLDRRDIKLYWLRERGRTREKNTSIQYVAT